MTTTPPDTSPPQGPAPDSGPRVGWDDIRDLARLREVFSRHRLDSVIHQPPPQRSKSTRGRPQASGKRLPSVEHLLHDPTTVWQRLTLDWYGQGQQTLEFCTGTGGTVSLWISSPAHRDGVGCANLLSQHEPVVPFVGCEVQRLRNILEHLP